MKCIWSIVFSLVFNCVFHLETSAQKQNNIWHFGHYAGLDFKTNPPAPLRGEMDTNEGCASIADQNGDLLFYTNGINVWDRQHHMMPNGFGLMGGNSSAESAIIAPLPNSCTQYYIFTVEDFEGNAGLTYSVVDMKLNNGFGDIISTTKNTTVLTSTPEMLTSVLHPNGKDIWILTHKFNSTDFYAYLLTENGLSTNPVISSVGSFFANNDGTAFTAILKTSHHGNKIVSVSTFHQICEVLDFNSTSGVVSNPLNLYSLFNDEELYGIEFSPNDSLLYLTSFSEGQNALSLSQINILDPIPQLFTISSPLAGIGFACCALQLGPDQKIYLSHQGQPYLDIIHQPDMHGVNCQFEQNGIALSPDTWSRHGLPQHVAYSFCPQPSLGNNQLRCIGDSVVLKPSFGSTEDCPIHLVWFDGSSDATKTLTSSGTYWCDIITRCSTYRDSIDIRFDTVLHSTVDVSICNGEVYEGYEIPGIYTDTFTSRAGCDSVRLLALTIRPPSSATIEEQICKGFSYEGYTSSGIYRDTFLANSGCDSIRTLRLTVVSCEPIIHYSLDACASVMSQGTHMDYSEFTPSFPTLLPCADVTAHFLYRAFPEKHSCTPGINDSPAMCVTTMDTCEYVPGSSPSVILEFTIDPKPDSVIQLTQFEFYEKGPYQYSWINGPAGLNNRPLLFGVRILKNDKVVYVEKDIPTYVNWGEHQIDLSINDHFLVDSFAHFRIELLSYCRVGNNSDVSVWDLDDITIYGGCVSPLKKEPFIGGYVYDSKHNGLPNVTMELSRDPLFMDKQIVKTDASGYYSFGPLERGRSYSLRGSKNDAPLNGVGVLDLVFIQKHLLGIQPFSLLNEYVAADADRNGTINVLDLILLRKLLLGIYTSFPGNTSWRFGLWPQDFTRLDLNYFREIKFFESLDADYHGVNFIGIKTGDLNGDARRK